MKHVDFQTPPMSAKGNRSSPFGPWHALSYTWGSNEKPRAINIEGQCLAVTENLWHALRRFERKQVWIDGVCINQDDTSERNAQVQRMADIYARANSTRVWLGEAVANSDLVLKFLRHLALYLISRRYALRKRSESWLRNLLIEHSAESRYSIHRTIRKWQDYFDRDHRLWPAACRFFNRPWFRRLWVLQEVVLARRVWIHVGGSRMNGATLVIVCKELLMHAEPYQGQLLDRNARDALRSIELMGRSAIHRLMSVSNFAGIKILKPRATSVQEEERLHDQRLEVILGRTLSSEATDLRDRVFGILGLVFPQNGLQNLVDYSLKTPTEVYYNLTKFCLMDLKSPMILSLAGTEIQGRRWSAVIPSWIPDLSQCSPHSVTPISMQRSRRPYSAPETTFECRIMGDILILKAAIVDTIHFALPCPGCFDGEDDEIANIALWLKECGSLPTKSANVRLNNDDDFTKALHTTMLWESWKSEDRFLWLHNMEFASAVSPSKEKNYARLSPSVEQFMLRFRSVDYGNRKTMMITEFGSLMSGPIASEVEDVVCLIPGAQVPYVLRPLEQAGHYRLVGGCYVYGLTEDDEKDMTDYKLEEIQLH